MSDADSAQHILPDVLEPGLRLVFCGTAAGTRSARDGAYYAHPGNMFWRAVHAVGLTPRLFAPTEYPLMPGLGIGFTDVAKFHHGNDNQLPRDAYDAQTLRSKIERHAPCVIAFTSKQAGMAALGNRRIPIGRQAERFGGAIAWVLPSPSGQARGSWNLAVWQAMADEVRQVPGVER
ncbi:mismatch-specific DNA-glycosylase [Luteibacter aegosomaticola]|uniref:mismatch-specific DNA-glycosylase n=1 Tax=Luteibacter aegosomaticola TaxID=2911538 RepID=UPI001FF8B7FA|nr:mismatch-specific DNA-glycosylase [Luteibacter aegosomaticola]UPG91869.1 mismatch-specific DNA-glycosylase [Luteibacter aegosomaticola]